MGACVAMELGTLGGCGAALGQMQKAGLGTPLEATGTQGGLGRTEGVGAWGSEHLSKMPVLSLNNHVMLEKGLTGH